MKTVCKGCCVMSWKQGLDNASNAGQFCPFCRAPPPGSDNESLRLIRKRVDARDPEAIRYLGDQYEHGHNGLEKSATRAIELWSEAAELGLTIALTKMGMAHYHGQGVVQDKAKGVRCWESAAMQGHAPSRHCLGIVEIENGKFDRAIRHYLISAKMGQKESLDEIKEMFTEGHATKDQYLEGLKGYQDAVEEMKSTGRDLAARLWC